MTPYEILQVLVVVIAVIIATTSLVRTRRAEEKQLEFQAVTAALAKKQLKALEKEEGAMNKADVTVELVKVDRSDFRFVLSNQGYAPAMNVNFTIIKGSPDNPLVPNECKAKLPYPRLEQGQSFTLLAALGMGSAMSYATQISWQNIDGSSGAHDVHVSV